ncbi:MAG: TIGR01777 family oxidoreductase [Ignavibacteria bacterium]|nr:TIGR01777 family oxidoreductase [Ignavibacteria bacterium]MBT8381984.1 TIGR01777 family oxidoreductase [Ignavibacteria bacterium]MBT8391300.1 TIGR01777 family oxidoreductase [Ignavibacteria bacterium]NNJ53488.1 TIGR01777 family protein [Ignavibacteriaceae bacterium]NNL20802.1 TIGR01777 family protein [Ignavibacteriaceae bacterium]
MEKILITGATGSIGRNLLEKLSEREDEITVFTRNPSKAEKKLPSVKKIVKWDFEEVDYWSNELNGKDVVIHLGGANLAAKRWNKEYKKLAYNSRIISTRNLVGAIKSVEQKPKAFICANAVGIYGDRGDETLDESSTLGNDFLANFCKDWEAEAKKVEELGVRYVSVRTGLVLEKDEGLMKKLIPSFKMFLGGYLGNGRQWFPWIHIKDIAGIYLHAIDNDSLNGSVNGASPGIVTNKEFSKMLGKVLNRPALFPIPKIALRIVSGELGNYVADSQRVSMDKILRSGYNFKFENLEEALRDLLE